MTNTNNQGPVYAKRTNTASEVNASMTQHTNDYVGAVKQFDQQTMELFQSHRTDIFGNKKADSQEMLQVKQNLLSLSLQMHETIPFPTSTEQIRANFATVLHAYDDSIQACENYIRSHKNPWTQEGKNRLAMVNQLYGLIKNDRKFLPDCASRLYKRAQQNPNEEIVWGNLLHEARSITLKMDLSEKEDIGGSISHVYRLENGNAAGYFKQNETRPKTEYQEIAADWLEKEKKKDPSLTEPIDALSHWIKTRKHELWQLGVVANVMHSNRIKFKGSTPLTAAQVDLLQQNVSVQLLLGCLPADSILRTGRGFQLLMRAAASLTSLDTMNEVAGQADIKAGRPMAERNVATSRMAKLLGMGDLVAESHLANIHDESTGKLLEGIVMKEASGTSFGTIGNDAQDRGVPLFYTPEAVHQLSNLQLLDTICGQVDRNDGNYLVQHEEKNGDIFITGITAIDNDMAFGNLTFDQLKHGVRELCAIQKPGSDYCHMPCIDRMVYERLQALKQEELHFFLQDLLAPEEIDALWDRCQKLSVLLRNTHSRAEGAREQNPAAPKFLLSADEWVNNAHRYGAVEVVNKKTSYARKQFVPRNPLEPWIEDNI